MHTLNKGILLIMITTLVMSFQTESFINKLSDLRANQNYSRKRNILNQQHSSIQQNIRILLDTSSTDQLQNKQKTQDTEVQSNINSSNSKLIENNKTKTQQNSNLSIDSLAQSKINSIQVPVSAENTTEKVQNLTQSSLNNSTSTDNWIETSVEEQLSDIAWISAIKFLSIIKSSQFFANQVILLLKKINSTGTFFNISSKIDQGIAQTLILVNLVNGQQKINLLDYEIVKNLNNTSLNQNLQYNLTQSVLQTLFYDFLLSPFNMTNAFQIHYEKFILYNLSYSNKNGQYNFFVKSELDSNGVFLTTVLKCNPIVFNITTHTSPVTANINIIYRDKNFQFVNQTINSFVTNTLNKSNYSVSYNSIRLWTDGSGSNILYYLNLNLSQNQTKKSYRVGVNYNLTTRQRTISYWKDDSSIAQYNKNIKQYQEVQYIQVAPNSMFSNVYLSARKKHVQNPMIKTQIKKVDNSTSFRLTYFGIDDKHAQVQYTS